MISTDTTPTPRRGFLGRLAAASLAVGFGNVIPTRLRAESLHLPGELTKPDVEHWLDGIKGKHRQVFDAPNPNEGFPMLFATAFLNTNNKASNIADRDLNAVIVLRHFAIPFAFTDSIWAKYKLGEAFEIKDPASKGPATRNFYYHPKEGDLHFPDAAIDRLLSRGAHIGVCGLALEILSGMRADAVGVPKDEAKREWTAAVIPGITILPSGVWGVNRAQEHGCTYCYAG